ncbi:aldehyde ferredoxin oxidoreductase N-terminal domain-containing protein [Chloroflexota bacterium]
MAENGYAGEILHVDLSDNITKTLPTADYADRFIGGRGIAAKLYWDMVPVEAKALDPENCIIFANGPAAGFNNIAGNRWKICGKSPLRDPEAFSYANLGGSWGTRLKYAGYDALAVQGKSEKPVYLYLHDGSAEIRDASGLWGKSAFETSYALKAEHGKDASVLAIGPAAENMVVFSTILADEGSSGSGGLGSVMGSKMLKAVVTAGNMKPKAADPERLASLTDEVVKLKKSGLIAFSPWAVKDLTQPHTCYQCGIGCSRQSYNDENGNSFKALCQSSGVFRGLVTKYYEGNEPTIHLYGSRLSDGYGLDSAVLSPLLNLLIRCYEEGIINEKDTGIPLSKAGSREFIEKLTQMIAMREGFGDTLAQGPIKTAKAIGKRAEELLSNAIATRAGEGKDYDPRLIITTSLLYATEPRRPINQLHDLSNIFLVWLSWLRGDKAGYFNTDDFYKVGERFWGSAVAADFSTCEGKPLAAKRIQDRTVSKESLVLCDFKWPMTTIRDPENPDEHVGDPAMESRVYSAITGKEIDEAGMDKAGERIYNLQRAILLRQGWQGREEDKLFDYIHDEPLKDEIFFNRGCRVPGKDGEVISRIGSVISREDFETMKDEYYKLRGWDVESGYPTETRLKELDLADIADDLNERGLLK